MRFIIILSCLFFVTSAFAKNQVYSFGSTRVMFWNFESTKIAVSDHCISNDQLNDCDALKNLKIISIKKLDRAKFGGLNPGAAVCHQQLKGIVMVGIDKISQNENSFCRLTDGSIIDNGTLIFYGIQNDRLGLQKTKQTYREKSDKRLKK